MYEFNDVNPQSFQYSFLWEESFCYKRSTLHCSLIKHSFTNKIIVNFGIANDIKVFVIEFKRFSILL